MARINKKQLVDKSCFDLAVERMALCFERFDKVFVSFSGGKDSTACLNIALEAAKLVGTLPLDVVTYDEEAIPPETVEYMERVAARPDVRFHWYCLPVKHRNACSRKHPFWYPWDGDNSKLWVRPLPQLAITELNGFHKGMSTEHCPPLVMPPTNGRVCNVMGIRCQESMTRYMSVATKKGFDCFTIQTDASWVSKAYPIYDWSVEDVWRAPARFGWDYNRAYDRMEACGVSRVDARCSPPYGEQPIRRLWSYSQCWPELWAKMTQRVHGAATAARYANTELYGIGVQSDSLPEGKTWKQHTLDTIEQLNGQSKVDVAEATAALIRQHAGCYARSTFTEKPIPDDDPDPVSGMCWKTIYIVAAAGGNKFGRQLQKATNKANKTRKQNKLCMSATDWKEREQRRKRKTS
jgi:predicted phosphoadenosine phosphosulfate sulfurtransferase